MLAFIAPGSAADKTTQPTARVLFDQAIPNTAARVVVGERHVERPFLDAFGYNESTTSSELEEIRLEIQQPGCEPILLSSYTRASNASPYELKEQPTVLGALVSHGRITLALAGENSLAIWEVNLVGEDPPATWRMLNAPWGAYGGVNWIDNARAEVKMKLGDHGHLMVGVRDKFLAQPQPLLWYEEEEPFGSQFKSVGQR